MGVDMTTTSTTTNNMVSRPPKVICPVCGKELSKSSLASHLNRVHDYHGNRQKGKSVVSQAQLSVTSAMPITSASATRAIGGSEGLEENEPVPLVIAKTERKRSKRGVKKLKGRVESESESESESKVEAKAEDEKGVGYWAGVVAGGVLLGVAGIAFLDEWMKRNAF